MLTLELEGVEVDWCPETGGIWLDDGELELLANKPGEPNIWDLATREHASGESTRKCPITGLPMEKWAFDDGSGTRVVVDASPMGHGIYLDQGELQQVLAMHPDSERMRGLIAFLNDMFAKAGEDTPEEEATS